MGLFTAILIAIQPHRKVNYLMLPALGSNALSPLQLELAVRGMGEPGWTGMPFWDAKGSPDFPDRLQFLLHNRLPYAEWLKKLGPQDRPPRGKCFRFFVQHARFR